MSNCDQFEQNVQAKLANGPAAFSPELLAILLPLIIDAITGLLDGCLSSRKRTDAEVAQILATDDRRRRYLVSKALRRSEVEDQHHKPAKDAVLSTLDEMDEESCVELVAEFRAEITDMVDWSFV